VIVAILPSKLNVTQESDSDPDSQILATIIEGQTLNTWIGVQGNAAISSPIYGQDNLPTDEEIQILWEGIDEELMTEDDVFLFRDPDSGVLMLTGLPAGNYRLISVGSSLADSECVDIVLSENTTFTANIITQKSAICFSSALPIRSTLASTGTDPGTISWAPISLAFFTTGLWMILVSRRKKKRSTKRS